MAQYAIRTGRIGHKNGIECFNLGRELKRVHQSYGAIELRLDCAVARSRERHTPRVSGKVW
jgi:hypothetical protein